MDVSYLRITLADMAAEERITFDLGLAFESRGLHEKFDTMVIAELKRGGSFHDSVFSKAMRRERIRSENISKYCLGVTCLIEDVKKNAFKAKASHFNKTYHDNA
jgi:hypothetical protein